MAKLSYRYYLNIFDIIRPLIDILLKTRFGILQKVIYLIFI